MESNEARRSYFGIARSGMLFALVAAISFTAGLGLGSHGSSAAAVIAHVPFLSDGLDATPAAGADLTDFWKAWNTLDAKYVLTQASSSLPTIKERIQGAISGLAASYDDPYTVFLPPSEAKAFAENISGSFAGVGMEIGIKDDFLTVIAPLKGTPAEAAGIRAGDKIATIDGESTDGMSVEEAVSKIRGPAGTTVAFTLIRDGKALEVKVVRDIIRVPQTEDGLDQASGVYHIALYEFTADSANLFNQALKRFASSGSKKLVVDLRGNPGGYLEAAVTIASRFLPKGATVVTEDFGGKEENRVHASRGLGGLPAGTKVVVLIDGGSASASEIFAGALQDHEVATVIGAKSFGKGSVQTLLTLGGGALKVTVARWITPNGNWIMANGVTPDIVVEYTKADAEADRDPQMARAIQFLTTGS